MIGRIADRVRGRRLAAARAHIKVLRAANDDLRMRNRELRLQLDNLTRPEHHQVDR